MNKKLYGRDISMRSTFLKYDPCVTGPKGSVECEDCMVSLISDRFLGEKFAREVLSKKYEKTKNLFTYVLIADTIGCNHNCWFCYAWKYLNLEDAKRISTHFLSSQELANQFGCKMRKTADLAYVKESILNKTAFTDEVQQKILKHIDLNLPFSRIRISGGEPLFSNNQVFQTDNESEDLILQTIHYWISFFEELDNIIGRIKQEALLNITPIDSDWQDVEYPVWLTEAPGRIMIRFDTNGLIFGKNKYTILFYEELFRLFQERKLNHIHVQIDYSFKGATEKEFLWSYKKGLPTTEKNNDAEVKLEGHPQVPGFTNMVTSIKEFVGQDKAFQDCVSYTVEKGIDHDPGNKVWLYNQHALQWQELAEKLGFEFSDVVNRFDLSFHWNFNAKVHRYTKRGAMIKLSDDDKFIDVTSASIPELVDFRRQHLDSDKFMTLVFPVDHPVGLVKKPREKIRKKVEIASKDQNVWIITGSEQNLRHGIDHGIWGVGKYHEELWKQLKEDDLVFFYCTRPISGIVGYGKIITKEVDVKPFWPNENPDNDSKYPLRIKFEPVSVVSDWHKQRKTLYGTGLNYFSGLNYVDPDKKSLLLKKFEI